MSDWTIEGGVWQIGAPTDSSGPAPYAGSNVAGTVLGSDYPNNADARLVSPEFIVPAANQSPRFKYFYWYRTFDAIDYGQVQIRVLGGGWQDLAGERVTNAGTNWSQRIIDLRAYAGQTIQIGFRFVSSASGTREGWFIDQVALETGAMVFNTPESFENGFGDWSAEGGVWQIGVPTDSSGPAPHSGSKLAGTILGSDYPNNADARLVSPEFIVPAANQSPRFKYFYWYRTFDAIDYGQVQIRVLGGGWQDLAGERLSNAGTNWSQRIIDLRAYAGQVIQIGFRFVSSASGTREGWFIDDVSLETGAMVFNTPEGFENGFGDWSAEGGVWQIGTPSTNIGHVPGAAYSGTQCAGTVLNGQYPNNTNARLVSPEFVVPAVSQNPRFKYVFWYSTFESADYGQVQIRVLGGEWQDLPGERVRDYGRRWSQRIIDLREYAGQVIQIGFHFVTDQDHTDRGWYIDDVSLETGAMAFHNPEGFENGFGDWSAEGGVWQIGPPSTHVGYGPGAAHSGSKCAGTLLDYYYPYNVDARLVSPEFVVPAASQNPRFKYVFWYSTMESADYGQVQIRAPGGQWQDVPGERVRDAGGRWSQRIIDLRAYAGQAIQIGFHFVSDGDGADEGPGWYIDDVSLETGAMVFNSPESFENGFGDWSTEGGVWQIGVPNTTYKPAPRTGTMLASTRLIDYYPNNADARLVSAEFIVPSVSPDSTVLLRYWQRYTLSVGDTGQAEVSVLNGTTWGSWEPLPIPSVTGNSPSQWGQVIVDIKAYTGMTIRVGFRFASNASSQNLGWHIDDVSLSAYVPVALGFGNPTSHTFTTASERKYFVLQAPAGGSLRLALDDLDNLGTNEIYLRRGALPTAGEYDFRFSTNGGADQQIFVPEAEAGSWYVLVIASSVPVGGSPVTLTGDFTSGPLVQSVSPTRVGNSVPATLTVEGGGFENSAQAVLKSGETVIATGSVSVLSRTRLLADFTLGGVAPGTYDLTIIQGSNSTALPLEVISGGQPKLETQLIVPNNVGRAAPGTLFVEYANTGNIAMAAPLLVIRGSDRAKLSLDVSAAARGLFVANNPRGFSDTVQLLATGSTPGLLQPGERIRVPFAYGGLQQPWNFSDSSVQFDLGVFDSTNNNLVDWNTLKAEMRPASIATDAWDALWANFVAGVGPTWGSYAAMLADNAIYLARLGLKVTDVSELLAFELAQADGLNPVSALAASTDAAARQPGLSLTFGRVFPQAITQRFRLGPLGRGWSHNWEFRLEKDADGNVTITGPGGARREFQPDVRGGFFNQAGDYGKLTALSGGVYELTEKGGLQWRFRTDGLLDYVQDLNANRITANYAGGLLTSLSHSSGQSLTFTYDGTLLQSVTDPYGRVTNFGYDGAQHLTSATAYGTDTTVYTYVTGQGIAQEHALASVAYPGGNHDYFTYDTRGRLASTSNDGGAHAVGFGYDSAGTVTVTDATAHSSKLWFDHRGLLAKAQDPLGNAVALAYDKSYNLTKVNSPSGAVDLTYDPKGNTTRTLNPLGHAITMGYGGNARLATLTDGRNNTTGFNYDAAGNATAMVYPNGSQEVYGNNARGDVVTLTNRRGQTTTLTRDATGRVTRKVMHEGRTFDYTYDARGNLSTVVDSELGTNTLVFNERDLLTQITYHDGKGFTFQYDDAGRRTQRTSHDNYTLKYFYDAAGRLHRLEEGTGRQIIEYLYDAAGRLSRENKGNGTWTTYEYDGVGQVLSLVNYGTAAEIISRFDYTYDASGNRTSMTTLEGVTTYTFDPTGQLTGVTHPEGRQVIYAYDGAGNRTRVADNGVPSTYTSNNLNQYTQVNGTSYTYDSSGNLSGTTDVFGTTTYQFSSEDELLSVNYSAGETWQFIYDAFGRRAYATHNGQFTRYVQDPSGSGNMVAEYTGGGSLTARYNYGIGLIEKSAFGTPYYYNYDAIGNSREITSVSGLVLNTYHYDPFGGMQSYTGTFVNNFTFGGRYGVMAEGALDFMRARHYSPSLGRFLSADPIGFRGDVNLYRYAGNSPVSLIDPKGTKSVWGELAKLFLKDWAEATIGETIEGSLEEYLETELEYLEGRRWRYEVDPANPNYDRQDAPIDSRWVDAHREVMEREAEIARRARKSYLPRSISNLVPPSTSAGVSKSTVAQAVDPNEIIGPSGYGTANYWTNEGVFAYRVNFENYEEATAPAQVVVIENPVPANLDISTLEFTSAGFGDQLFTIPAGTQHYEHTAKMTFNGTTFDVLVEVRLDREQRKVLARFESIEPFSGLPPTVDVGFLPPEDGTGRGKGHIAYVVKPDPAIPTSTEIRNIGYVTFDPLAGGATYRTDLSVLTDPNSPPDPNRQALVTIDSSAPASSVTPLPTYTGSSSFNFAWSGSDVGAGITGYDIYARTDGGQWTLVLQNISDLAAIWQGDYGKTYGFYSIARDGAGNIEPLPATPPDAQTTTVGPLTARAQSFANLGASRTFTLEVTKAIPNETLSVQRTLTLGGEWTAIGTIIIGTDGVGQFEDHDPPEGAGFYKVERP